MYADVAEHVPLAEVLAAIAGCRSDLDAPSAAALPEMVELLASQRLATRLPADGAEYRSWQRLAGNTGSGCGPDRLTNQPDSPRADRPGPDAMQLFTVVVACLALFQARGITCLVLDGPTNHLDVPAIEPLEQALAGYDGTLLVVTHDRQLASSVRITRKIDVLVLRR